MEMCCAFFLNLLWIETISNPSSLTFYAKENIKASTNLLLQRIFHYPQLSFHVGTLQIFTAQVKAWETLEDILL
jgi:hypothetical protein